jgi:hypothetical protein
MNCNAERNANARDVNSILTVIAPKRRVRGPFLWIADKLQPQAIGPALWARNVRARRESFIHVTIGIKPLFE